MEENEKLLEAKKRVKALKDFYGHVVVYVVVNSGLFLINLITSPDVWWFYWPVIGWGIGLAIHGITVYTDQTVFGKEWEEKKIKEIMDKDKSP